jgi:hypothetical protein
VSPLTPDQRALFDKYPPEHGQSESQTRFNVDEFCRIAELELGDAPAVADVLVEMDLRSLREGEVTIDVPVDRPH